jgi:hypothetical protein
MHEWRSKLCCNLFSLKRLKIDRYKMLSKDERENIVPQLHGICKFSAFIITSHLFTVFARKTCAGLKDCVKFNSSYHQMRFNFSY